MKHIPDTAWATKNLRLDSQGPRKKINTIILLKILIDQSFALPSSEELASAVVGKKKTHRYYTESERSLKSAVKEMSQSNSSLHLGLRNPNEKKKKIWYPEWTEDMKKTNSSKYNTVYANSTDPSSLLFTVSVLRMAFYVFKKT